MATVITPPLHHLENPRSHRMSPPSYSHPMQQAVAEFHRAFGMPDLIHSPGGLPADRVDLRHSLIREEGVVELSEAIDDVREGRADTPVEIIDALIDTIYVALGALVEMGQEVSYLPRSARYPELRLPLVQVAWREKEVISYLLEVNEASSDRTAPSHQYNFAYIAYSAHLALVSAGIDPQPYFDEVQRANMSKLGADGRPIHSRGLEIDGYPEGKVLKGPNYSPPDLAAVYRRLELGKQVAP
jgi:predicted HAD superfamily Cof-like phosphohydrolase